jgi:hypothetical protein
MIREYLSIALPLGQQLAKNVQPLADFLPVLYRLFKQSGVSYS